MNDSECLIATTQEIPLIDQQIRMKIVPALRIMMKPDKKLSKHVQIQIMLTIHQSQ